MMKLDERAALLRQAAAAMDELKRLCLAEGGHGHTVICCERMAEACREAAEDAERLLETTEQLARVAEALTAQLAAEDDADGEAGTT